MNGSRLLALFALTVSVFASPRIETTNVVCDGDSITSGVGVSIPWSSSLAPKAGRWKVTNLGIPGQFISTMRRNAPRKVDALFISEADNIVIVWAGSNDLAFGGSTPRRAYEDIRSYALDRKNRGWKVIVVGAVSRNGCDDKIEELDRLLIDNHSFADQFVSLPASLTAPGAFKNAALFQSEGIHPNQFAVSTLIAPEINSAVRNLVVRA
jgi:lysophospholipase L1-like esterase